MNEYLDMLPTHNNKRHLTFPQIFLHLNYWSVFLYSRCQSCGNSNGHIQNTDERALAYKSNEKVAAKHCINLKLSTLLGPQLSVVAWC